MALRCTCCGEEREVVALRSREDVRVCRGCIDWLGGQLGVQSTPTLPVTDLAEAKAFYERAGFHVRVYIDPDGEPGGFAFVDCDGQSVFDLGVEDIDPTRNRAGCYLVVRDVDDWHTRMERAGLPVTPVADQPWGMREYALTDPSGNRVRIGEPLG